MIKTTFALLATVVLATSSAFAGGACCAGMSADGKMDCSKAYAQMNLTADQKTKLDAAQADCQKAGCTKESMDKFMHSAKHILSAKQYAELKSQCARMQPAEKTKS
ncbi:MAG TPA: hypothetical protein VNW28_02710 [Chthoniobacterales bacterium]|nr:hypothetical protein [Chthoniobacterales bacterium]